MGRQIINKILQKSDVNVTLIVKDASGALYDLSGASKLGVIVYYQGHTVLQKYSMNSSSGWKDLDVTSAADGELSFKLESDDTDNANEGKIYAEIWAQFPDVDYEDSMYDLLGNDIYIGEIVKSNSSGLTLP